MICDRDDERLGDYVDGTLPPAETARLEAHLAGCPRCRAVAADLRAIRSLARSLEPQVPPPHVWPRLSEAARTAARPSWFGAFLLPWRPAASAAMAAVLSMGLWWTGSRLALVTPSTGSRLSSVEAAFAGSAPLVPEVHYSSAIARLEALTGSGRDALDPSMVDVLDTGMTIIDAAIDQSRAALETEPDSRIAQQSLLQALRSKVALLQDMLALVNEMRIDGPDVGRPTSEAPTPIEAP